MAFKAFRTALRASQVTFLWWAKKGNPKKAHPALVPCAHSLCFGCARLLRGSLTAHPCAGSSRAHIVWALLRTFPSQARHERGDPMAMDGRSAGNAGAISCRLVAVLATASSHALPSCAAAERDDWSHCSFQRANSRVSCRATQSDTGARRPCSRPWMAELAPARGRQGAKGTSLAVRAMHETRVAFSLVTFLLATQEKVTRAPKVRESLLLEIAKEAKESSRRVARRPPANPQSQAKSKHPGPISPTTCPHPRTKT